MQLFLVIGNALQEYTSRRSSLVCEWISPHDRFD